MCNQSACQTEIKVKQQALDEDWEGDPGFPCFKSGRNVKRFVCLNDKQQEESCLIYVQADPGAAM